MRFLRRLFTILRVLPTARRNRLDLPRWLIRRPPLLFATGVTEMAVLTQNRVHPHLRALAEMKAAAMVACEYCIDIGAAVGKVEGLRPEQITELHRFEDSDAYSDLEKLTLRFATVVSATPAIVPDELRDELEGHLGKAGLAELAFTIAWEHKRGRLNQALGVRPSGFADGMACAVPLAPSR